MSLLALMRGEKRSAVDLSWNSLVRLLGRGTTTDAGISVTPQSALNFSAVFACRRVINSAIGSLPLGLYRATGNVRERLRDDLRDAMMRRKPQEGVRTSRWRMTIQDHALGWGNGVALKEYGSRGRLVGLRILRPDWTEIETEAGRVKYWYRPRGGKREVYYRDQVLHIAGMGFDGTRGYSVIDCARQAIGKGMAAEKYAAEFFRRGARHDLVGTFPTKLSPQAHERLTLAIEKMTRGDSYGTLLLEEGGKVESVSIPARDAQWLEGSRFTVEEICRFYGVPKSRVHEDSQTQPRANREEDNRVFIEDTLTSWLRIWEDELAEATLTEAEELGGAYWKFSLQGLLRGDTEKRYDAYTKARQWGLATADEIRALEDQNPLGGTAGETVLIPINMVPIRPGEEVAPQVRSYLDALGPHAARLAPALRGEATPSLAQGLISGQAREEPPAEPSPPPSSPAPRHLEQRSLAERRKFRNAFVRLFEQAAQHWVGREVAKLRQLIERAAKAEEPVAVLTEGLEQIYDELPAVVRRDLLPVLSSLATLVREAVEDEGYEIDDLAGLDAFVDDRADSYSRHYAAASRGQLEALVAEGGTTEELTERLSTRVGEWAETRAGKEGAAEATYESAAVAVYLYAAAGVGYIRWHTFGTSCPLCTKLAGATARVGGTFLPRGAVVEPDAEGVAPLTITRRLPHAPLHRGCDCGVTPA